ncbi:MAG: site-2 protease family protein, partial [Oscillospiraceae bacterium]|nr:site-2 protease family protein [Oscillospiraceae bacterium]
MYIIVGIIAFGILIAVHELGHFTVAKLLGVRVNEFAIGMGPKLLKRQGKETLYSLRVLPLGGFCALEGENGNSEDTRSFTSQKRWRRVIILAAGGIANMLAGFIIVLILVSGMSNGLGKTTITELVDGFPNGGEQGLMVGDTILSINGERLY